MLCLFLSVLAIIFADIDALSLTPNMPIQSIRFDNTYQPYFDA